MKQQADSHRSDRHFDVGDWVYFKVQPYKQATISNHLSHKLVAMYMAHSRLLEELVQ